MKAALIALVAFLFMLGLAAPLLRKTKVSPPPEGWKKIEDEDSGFNSK